MEIWKMIPGFDGYEASSEGRIRSVDRVVTCANGVTKRLKGRVLSPCFHSEKHPYPYVQLGRNGGTNRMFAVHRLVAWAFLGPQPEGVQVRHKDGDAMNAKSNNLAYGSPKENQADRLQHGTAGFGAQHSQSRLTDDQVVDIRARLKAGALQEGLAEEFGVSQSHISGIKTGRAWKHLKEAA